MLASAIVAAELGWRVRRQKRRVHSTFSLGLGYLVEVRTLGVSVALGNGAHEARDTERRHYAVPMLSYTLGQDTTARFGHLSCQLLRHFI